MERIHKPILKRAFGNAHGTLDEGPMTDFRLGWVHSFEQKPISDGLSGEVMAGA